MQRISDWWKTLSPDKKKAVSAGGVVAGLLLVLYLFIAAGPEETDRRRTVQAETSKNILTGSDPKSLGLDALGNDLRKNEEATKKALTLIAQQEKRHAKEKAEQAREIERLANQLNLLRADTQDKLGTFSRSQQDALKSLRNEVRTLEDGTVVPVEDTKPGTLAPADVVSQGLFDHPSLTPAVATGAPGANNGRVLKVRVFGEEKVDRSEGVQSPHTVYLPSGAIISGVLINGVDAPTGNRSKRDPMPALARVKHDAILPNRYRSDVKECFIIVGTTGDLSTERAFMRGESLSCIRNDGRLIEVDIDAYAVGEDGKVGMRGRLVSRNGALVAKGAMAGFAQAMSNIFRPVQVQSFNTSPDDTSLFQAPDPGEALEASAYAGFSGAMGQLADYYIDLADQIVPFIEVDAGRKIDLVLLKGAELTIREEGE